MSAVAKESREAAAGFRDGVGGGDAEHVEAVLARDLAELLLERRGLVQKSRSA
jgi:hypothetical protein